MRARRDEAQRFFAGAAGAWDKLRGEVYGPSVAPRRSSPSSRPSGSSRTSGAARARSRPSSRRASGRSSRSTSRPRCCAGRAAGSRAKENVEIHEARLEALPLRDASCDAALPSRPRVPRDPRPALREAARILRRAGGSSSWTRSRHADEDLRRRMGQRSPGSTPRRLTGLSPKPGSNGPSCRTVPPEPGAKGPGLVIATARRLRRAAALVTRLNHPRRPKWP